MKLQEINSCSFQNWYSLFKDITIQSLIVPLPEGFVEYILKDGIVLPKNSKPMYSVEAQNSDTSDEETDWENTEIEMPEAPHFPLFDKAVEGAIESLGGKVFPKLNWSSPKDASWIAFNNSCCCTSVSDVYLLLKSSDFIVHDLTKVYAQCDDSMNSNDANSLKMEAQNETFYLILRKWTEIDTAGEFRCFVKDNSLIGISQREHSLYFEHISQQKEDILADIVAFYKKNIESRFPCKSYVFDIYRKKKEHVYLIDFNPFDVVTESLLFEWGELKSKSLATNDDFPEFRFVHNNHGVQPRTLSYHAMPKDIIDISTGQDSFKLVDLMKLNIEGQNQESSDDAEN